MIKTFYSNEDTAPWQTINRKGFLARSYLFFCFVKGLLLLKARNHGQDR